MNKFFYSPTKKQSLLCIGIVLTAVFISFSPVLKADFLHFNDYTNVVTNNQIRSLSLQNIKSIFQSKIEDIYVPLTVLTWAVEYRFFKLNPFVYHLNNLLLHLGVVVLIYLMARKFGLSIIAASVAGLLFGIHPAHVESVAWVTERKDVLYAFLYVGALYAYMFYVQQCLPGVKRPVKSYRYLIITTVLGALSILAKPMALSLPVILLLFDWFKGRQLSWAAIFEKFPLMLIMGAVTWLSDVPFMLNRWRGMESLLVGAWSGIFYIKQFIMPLVLMPIYRVPQPVDLTNTEYVFSCVVFVVLIGAFIYFRRYKWFVFAILYYLFSIFFLLRVSADTQINLVADRFMYLPSLGICLLLSYAFDRLINRGRASTNQFVQLLPVICIAVLFMLLGIKTFKQASVWQNDQTLWTHQLKNNPQEYVALTHLATSLIDDKEYREAIKRHREIRALKLSSEQIGELEGVHDMFKKVDYIESLFKRSIKINPEQPESHYNLGYFYELLGVVDKALLHYSLAATLNPQYSDLYLRIGVAHMLLNQPEKAVASFEKLLSQNTDDAFYIKVILAYKGAVETGSKESIAVYIPALKSTLNRYVALVNSGGKINEQRYYNLGSIYGVLSNFEEALRAYSMVLEANPQNIEAYFHSGISLRHLGRFNEAIEMYDQALKIDYRRVDILLEKALLLSKMKRREEAIAVYEDLIKIDSDQATALFNLGFLYEQMEEIVKAKGLYEKAVKLDSSNADLHYNLGNIYAQIGNIDKAKVQYLKATAINPGYENAWVNLTVLTFQEGNVEKAYEYYKQAQVFGYLAPEAMRGVFENFKNK